MSIRYDTDFALQVGDYVMNRDGQPMISGFFKNGPLIIHRIEHDKPYFGNMVVFCMFNNKEFGFKADAVIFTYDHQ